ncbi:MAG: non-heme iron oxygenase ferredoxin subunit [Candidatus Dadabacteria bacterium]|nr:non-heme iron oxygenase ferredoxin subunit [Candidatus Dadabacteria bacterium]MCY4262008.1 non-heme iron oxygenase ferredoxin subunit [Candidatus Dadabacteria bacterium]
MSDYEKVAKVTDIAEGDVESFFVGADAIAICRVDGNFYAFRDECTHQSFTLSDGDLEGERITCCYHGAEFNVRTGEALCLPAVEPLETYSVKIDGADILVKIDD